LASTRILLVALPRMLEEIVSHILRSQRGIEVTGTIQKTDGLSRKVARARPDLVVLGRDDPEWVAALLEQSPRLKVLAVAEGGQDSWLYGLNPVRMRLGALSPPRLVGVITRAVRLGTTSAWWNR
jgi:hypothetical protein